MKVGEWRVKGKGRGECRRGREKREGERGW